MSTAIGQHFSLGTKINFPLRWRKKDSKMAGDMVIGTVIIASKTTLSTESLRANA